MDVSPALPPAPDGRPGLPEPVLAALRWLQAVVTLPTDSVVVLPDSGRPDPLVVRSDLERLLPRHQLVAAPGPGGPRRAAARRARIAALRPDAVVLLASDGTDAADLRRADLAPTALVECTDQVPRPPDGAADLVIRAGSEGSSAADKLRAWLAGLPSRRPAPGRPSLAVVSPWPPTRSGVAEFAAFTAPYLTAAYDVTVVTDGGVVPDTVSRLGRADFERGWWRFDRVLYHLGNSVHHSEDLDLLARAPGVVVLHDAVLTGALHGTGDGLRHPRGTEGLLADSGPPPPPGTADVRGVRAALAPALGIVVHSRHAANLLREAAVTTEPLAVTLLATPVRPPRDAWAADHDDVPVLGHFGFVNPYKGAAALIAGAGALVARGVASRVVFVGEFSSRGLLAETRALAERLGVDMTVTGFADEPEWLGWLDRVACAVQLRPLSHGESSAALGELLARGLPVVCSDGGSFAELPEGVVRHVPQAVDPEHLADVLTDLLEPTERAKLSAAATRYARVNCAPETWARAVGEALESAYAGSLAVCWAEEAARFDKPAGVAPGEFALRGRSGAGYAPWLTDVSVYAGTKFFTGIQRVAARLHAELAAVLPSFGAGLHPAYITEGLDEEPDREIAADPMSWRPAVPLDEGEWLLLVDLNVRLARHREELLLARRRGLRIAVVMHDLMPVLHPEWFPREAGGGGFAGWLRAMLDVADLVVANSEATAADVRQHVAAHPPRRDDPLEMAVVPWGWDFNAVPEHAPAGAADRDRDHFLMVGTIEPRKGHRQVLDAFEGMWAAGSPARLTVVGRRGWMVDDLVARMTRLDGAEPRFRWREGADDDELAALYATSTAMLMASHGEGFGLPVVEAALRGCPVVVRHIPVLREVAGDEAIYFSAGGGDLRRVLEDTLTRAATGPLPVRSTADLRRWRDVAGDLAAVLQGRTPPTSTWLPAERHWS